MAATVFFLDPLPGIGEIAVLDGPEGRHAATVRRIGVGEKLVLADGCGEIADGEVVGAAKDRLDIRVVDRRSIAAPSPRVTVVQALPKAERSELAVELATEAGADAFIPWQASRCVARWDGLKATKGVVKWRNAAIAAAKQARRAWIPEVADVHRTSELAGYVREQVAVGGLVVILHESATAKLTDLPLRDAPSVTLIVGPEGGVSDEEVAALIEAGAIAALLGPQVLRTSSASAVALGAIGASTARWDAAPLT